MNDFLQPKEGEREQDYLLRLGSLKEHGQIKITWDDLAHLLNAAFRSEEDRNTESYWRKRYRKCTHFRDKPDVSQAISVGNDILNLDEASRARREERRIARNDDLIDKLIEATKKAEPIDVGRIPFVESDHAIVAMLSDIHYGLTFSGPMNEYNSKIAAGRVMNYADEIVRLGHSACAEECYVVLMGDMISGIIKSTVRIENRENLVEQIVGVSEIVTAFLIHLSLHFSKVYVYSVDGNHSRIDINAEAGLRNERLDSLIPWYCTGRLRNIENVEINANRYDSTFAAFKVFNSQFVCVHGDLDPNLHESARKMETIIGNHIDYFLSAHMHVPFMSFETTGFIRNGCVCGSGDDYTSKKRLFGEPMQVALVVNEDGVESVHPIKLQ